MRSCALGRLAVAAAASALLPALHAGAAGTTVPVTSCSQSIDYGEIGVLEHDITCQHTQIVILLGGGLDLNGFTITKLEDDVDEIANQEAAVFCDRQCEVFSSAAAPGRIVGPGPGVLDPLVGIEGGGHGDGAIGTRRMRVENVEIRNFDMGIRAELARLQARRVAVHDSDTGILTVRLTAEELTLSGNHLGADVDRIRARGVECTNSSFRCIYAAGAVLDGITANGNETGVYSTRLRIADGVLAGNTVDIASAKLPRLTDTSCETSRRVPDPPPASWGVCSLDP